MTEHSNLVRLRWVKSTEIPATGSSADAPSTDGGVDLSSFISTALFDAETFMTSYFPKKFTVKSKNKQSPPSTAPVELLTHTIPARDLRKGQQDAEDETWFARTSIHENAAKAGTASWEEFDFGLRVDHSQHEMAYTPSVFDAHEVMNWDSELEAKSRQIGEWEDVHMNIMEMGHRIPAPMDDRVFPIIVITARKPQEFLVVQIPVATKGLPNPKYHNVPKVTGGVYCSIERCQLIDGDQKVKWEMATASNARGWLPMWMQKMGVPGAVVKDVGWFIKWCAERRNEKK